MFNLPFLFCGAPGRNRTCKGIPLLRQVRLPVPPLAHIKLRPRFVFSPAFAYCAQNLASRASTTACRLGAARGSCSRAHAVRGAHPARGAGSCATYKIPRCLVLRRGAARCLFHHFVSRLSHFVRRAFTGGGQPAGTCTEKILHLHRASRTLRFGDSNPAALFYLLRSAKFLVGAAALQRATLTPQACASYATLNPQGCSI